MYFKICTLIFSFLLKVYLVLSNYELSELFITVTATQWERFTEKNLKDDGTSTLGTLLYEDKNDPELASSSHVLLWIQNTTQIPFHSCVCTFHIYIKYMCIHIWVCIYVGLVFFCLFFFVFFYNVQWAHGESKWVHTYSWYQKQASR